jgi:FixJ family two-component response regulator
MYQHSGDKSGTFQDIIKHGDKDGDIANHAGPPAICVIDRDERIRELIAAALDKELFVVRTYETVAEFLIQDQFQPECLLVDFAGQSAGLADLLGLIEKRNGCAVPVIVIGSDSIGAAVQCMKAGASDYVAKPLNEATLADCVRRMSAIGRTNRAKTAHIVAAKAKVNSLTKREKQVLDLMIGGRSNRAVGAELDIRAAVLMLVPSFWPLPSARLAS